MANLQIKNSWGLLYDLQNRLPILYLTDNNGNYWSSKRKNNVKPNDRELLYQIENNKHFTLRRQSGSRETQIIIEAKHDKGILVDGKSLRKKKQVENGKCSIFLHDYNIDLIFEAFCDMTDDVILTKIENKYRYISLLGKGGFGRVFKGFNISQEKLCAIKTEINLGSDSLRKENRIASMTKHENIITFFDFFDINGTQFLISELGSGGSMYYKVGKTGPFKENALRHAFKQVFQAIYYLHSNNIYHRDLKPENCVLMTSEELTTVKIIDFGVSCISTNPSEMKSVVGAYRYMAPEVLAKKLIDRSTKYTDKVDIWGIGVMLFFCLTGDNPFGYNKELIEYRETMKNEQNMNTHISSFKKASQKTKNIVQACLRFEHEKRPSAKKLIDYNWII